MDGTRRFVVRVGDNTTPVHVLADGRVSVGDGIDAFVVRANAPGEYLVTGGGAEWRVVVAGPPDARWVGCAGVTAAVDVQSAELADRRPPRAAPGGLSALMPGTVIDVSVTVGQRVRAGDTLLTLEAMKMQLPVRAPRDGVVSAVRCSPGELVQPGTQLVELA